MCFKTAWRIMRSKIRTAMQSHTEDDEDWEGREVLLRPLHYKMVSYV